MFLNLIIMRKYLMMRMCVTMYWMICMGAYGIIAAADSIELPVEHNDGTPAVPGCSLPQLFHCNHL